MVTIPGVFVVRHELVVLVLEVVDMRIRHLKPRHLIIVALRCCRRLVLVNLIIYRNRPHSLNCFLFKLLSLFASDFHYHISCNFLFFVVLHLSHFFFQRLVLGFQLFLHLPLHFLKLCHFLLISPVMRLVLLVN